MPSVNPASGPGLPRVGVLACSVLEAEVRQFAAGHDHIAAIEILEQGLHDDPDRLRAEVQAGVTQLEDAHAEIGAVVLGYGLCSRGIEGVATARCRLVIPRAHDCITLLLGSKERYADYAAQHPGTYWYSPGWNDKTLMPGPARYAERRKTYAEAYGEEEADFLMESLESWYGEYDRAAFVDLGAGAVEDAKVFTKNCAQWLGWEYDEQQGDPGLLQTLLTGPWDAERFLVLAPGETAKLTADARVIEKRE